MIKLKKIITEIIKEQKEIDYDLFDIKNETTQDIFINFLYKNNADMTNHIPWQLVSFPRLKKVWEDFVRTGQVRDEKGLENIENIMQQNTIKLWILTELAGHTSYDPSEDFKEAFIPYINNYIQYKKYKNIDPNQYQMNFDKFTGKAKKSSLPKKPTQQVENKYLDDFIEIQGLKDYKDDELVPKLYEELMDKFANYYSVDPKSGADYMSDYGLEPLLKGLSELRDASNAEEKLPIIDQMLNVVHQRSDMAAWFVEGGSRALSQLSGMEPVETDD